MAKDPDCIFCKIIAGEIPAMKVAESENCVAILDAFPATKGHALILTKDHKADFLEMTEAELAESARLMQRIGAAAQKAFGCPGINFIGNLGKTAGQVVMHAHLHVLPRYENDSVGMTFQQLKLSDTEKQEILDAIKSNM